MAASGFFAKILDEKNRGPLLIMAGVLMIVFSMGHLEIGNAVKFIPSRDVSSLCVYLVIAIGTFLVFTGIVLILHQRNILQPLLRKLFYVFISIVFITGVGVIAGMRYFPKEKPDVIQCYTVNRKEFQVYFSFWKIREYTRDYQNKSLLIVYRKQDPSLLFEDDPHITIKRFAIQEKDMETLMIPFSYEFSKTLTPGTDLMEFAIWLCPKQIQLDKITTGLDIEKHGGKLLETASATVQTHHRWSGRHCPQFLTIVPTTNALRSECPDSYQMNSSS